MTFVSFILGLFAAFIVGTFVEYWGHRLMHEKKLLVKTHAVHHGNGTGQGVLGEFKDYFLPSLMIIWVGFPFSIAAGIGFALGDFLYALAAAYAHQVQHEHPELVFWLKQPVHYVHHRHRMWNHNFGIFVDIWDRILGTYKEVEWTREVPEGGFPLSAWLEIHWASESEPIKPLRASESNA
jgi:sterol desaturase/sphingolipid hydroxylase (fatty acid hydroxylase superfamily)